MILSKLFLISVTKKLDHLKALYRVWFCGGPDGRGLLHGRHPAFDRPVLHRGRTEEERADAPETPEAAPIRTDGQMSTRD